MQNDPINKNENTDNKRINSWVVLMKIAPEFDAAFTDYDNTINIHF